MKKVLLSMMTAAIFFASCSNDDTAVPENNNVTNNNQEELVAIKLGAGSIASTTVVESKAAVEEWNANQIGVFALDRNNSWDTTIEENDRPVLLNNELGTVGPDAEGETEQIEVVWTNATNNILYYPRYSTRTYSFYAYHPYVSDENVTINNGNSIMVTGTFTGQEDIMVGNAICKSDLGYNAKYFRDIEKEGNEETPDIKFNHLTTRLKIKVAAGHKYNPETCTINTLKMDIPTGYTLRVASTDLAQYPQEIRSWNAETTELQFGENIALTAGEDDSYATSDVVADILTKPGAESYELILTLPGINEPIIAPVSYPATEEEGASNVFEAGKAYTITLTINGPQEIKVTASLTPWDEETPEIGVEI